MPRTLINLTGHDHVGHLKWADASGSQYMSVSGAIDSRMYAVSNDMSFAGTLGLDATQHQYYLNKTGCSNCAGNCRCSHCSMQDDIETDFGMKDLSDMAKKAAGKAGQFAHKAGEAAGKAYEAVKAGHAAVQEKLDPGGVKRALAAVQRVENDEKTAQTDLEKLNKDNLSTELREKITEAHEKLTEAQKALQELKGGLVSVAGAVVGM